MFPTVRSLSLFAFACLLLSPAFASEADHKVNINSPISFALPQTLTFTLSLTRSLFSLNSHSDLSIYIWVFFSSILCFENFQHFLLLCVLIRMLCVLSSDGIVFLGLDLNWVLRISHLIAVSVSCLKTRMLILLL